MRDDTESREPAAYDPASSSDFTPPSPTTEQATPDRHPDAQPPAIEEEVLVEEVSIDGMCGVY